MRCAVINNSVGRDVGTIHRLYNWKELQRMYLYEIPAYVYIIRHLPSGQFYFGSRYKHINDNVQHLPIDRPGEVRMTHPKSHLDSSHL